MIKTNSEVVGKDNLYEPMRKEESSLLSGNKGSMLQLPPPLKLILVKSSKIRKLLLPRTVVDPIKALEVPMAWTSWGSNFCALFKHQTLAKLVESASKIKGSGQSLQTSYSCHEVPDLLNKKGRKEIDNFSPQLLFKIIVLLFKLCG